jgi:hypothetical protein
MSNKTRNLHPTNGAKKSSTSQQKPKAPKKAECFIISPFGGWNDRYYLEIYKPAVEAAGLNPRRADDLYRPSAIVHDIWILVKNSRVMLADLTGKNPNVFYELGLAHALGKPVILLTQSMNDVPFDLRALRVIEYEVQDPTWSAVLRIKIEKALGEVLDSPEQAVLPTFMQGDYQDKKTSKSPIEKRLLELQRQVNLLSSGSSTSDSSPEMIAGPTEAEELIKELLRTGMPDQMIIEQLARRRVPPDWAKDQLRRLRPRIVRYRHGLRSSKAAKA